MGLSLWTNLGPIALDSDTHPDSVWDLPEEVLHIEVLAAEQTVKLVS